MTTFEFPHFYTPEDHAEVFQNTNKSWWLKQRGRIVWWLILVALGSALLWALNVSDLLLGLFFGLVFGWIIFFSVAWKQRKKHWDSIWSGNPSFQGELRTELAPDGLRRTGADTEFFCTWKAFTSLEETPNLFILYTGSSWFLTIPKRVFDTKERLNELRSFLSTQIQSKTE